MYRFEMNKISKNDFLMLDEKNVMFITNPGRMGDEDGSTFIVKDGNDFTIYRVDGWMYPSEEETITLEETAKQFPKWYELWKSEDKNNNEKYKYLYMGFGNGLCIDNSIYDEFEPYLNELVGEESKEGELFNLWPKAFINMVNDKKIF